MKKTFIIKEHYFKNKNEKYYVIEQKILGIFNSEYIVPVLYSENKDYIITYTEYKFSDPNKAVDVLQMLEKFYIKNKNEVQIAWDFVNDIYMYIPKNNLSHTLVYGELINKKLMFTDPVDALVEYYEIEKRKKSFVERKLVFKDGIIQNK
jgi:hypothetical protein